MGTDSTKTRKQVLAFIAVSNIPAPRTVSFTTWHSSEPGVSVTFDAIADLRAFLGYVLAPKEPVHTWTQDSDFHANAYCDWGGYRFQLWANEPDRDDVQVDDETASALAAVLDPPSPVFTTPTAPPPPVGGPSHPDGPAIPGLPSIEDDAWDDHADPVPLPHPVFKGRTTYATFGYKDPALMEYIEDGHKYMCCGKVGRISRHEAWCPAVTE